MVDVLDRFRELSEQKEKLDQERKELFEQVIRRIAEDAFAIHPNLLGFQWVQYTPYFNDGDVCYFGVQETEYKFDDTGEGDYGNGYETIYKSDNSAKQHVAKIIGQIFELVADEELSAYFGDHKRIQVTRGENGKAVIDISDYDHD